MVIKARKQGNSIVLTIPKSLNVSVNTEFTVNLQKNGDLLYKKTTNKGYDLWSDPAYDNYDYESEIKSEYKELGYNPREVNPIGKELDNNEN